MTVYNKIIHKTNSEATFGCTLLGWGYNKDAKLGCYTNEFGPAPHTLCSFPFHYNGQSFYGCIKSDVPSSQHLACKIFFKWVNENNIAAGKINKDGSYSIEYHSRFFSSEKNGSQRHVRCYNPSLIDNGWCGTCYDFMGSSTKKYEEGYCSGRRKGNPYNIIF